MAQSASTLKLGTWNLALPVSARRRAAIQEHLDRESADVWVFTEAHDGFVGGGAHAHHSSAGRDGKHLAAHRWVTIRSQFPLQELATSDPLRSACARVLPPNGDPFVVFGSVLPWAGSKWREHESPKGVAFRHALETQAADWAEIQRRYPSDEFFVIGDLNQELVSPRYYGSKANRAALEENLAKHGLQAFTSGENDPIRRDSAPCAAIDHVCGKQTSRWKLKETRRWPDAPKPDRWLSDHFGVLVALE